MSVSAIAMPAGAAGANNAEPLGCPTAAGRAACQGVSVSVGVPMDKDPRDVPARSIHARKTLVQARRKRWNPKSTGPLGMPHDLGVVTVRHRGPRPVHCKYQCLANQHARLALRVEAVYVRWKPARYVLRWFASDAPDNRRSATGGSGSPSSGGAVVPRSHSHIQVCSAVDARARWGG